MARPAAPPQVEAALALIERRGRYLICRRPAGGPLGGYWEFPGGKREPGESWTGCLRRELREELGIAVRTPRLFCIFRYRYPHAAIAFRAYRCAIAGRPRARAAQALRWVPAARLSRYAFPPANRRLLALLRTPHAIITTTARWTSSRRSPRKFSPSKKPRRRSPR